MPRRAGVSLPRIVPHVETIACPIQTSLGVLGHKWALPVLRDVAFLGPLRFSDILRLEPGMTARVLSARLKALTREAFITREPAERGREVFYKLTPKGRDAVPILTALMQFAFKHHADEVFQDGRPRTLQQVLPGAQRALLGDLRAYAARVRR